MLVILFLNHVYYTSRLDIVSYSLVALYGMIVTLLVSSVSFFSFFLLMGYLCLFLPHELTNEYKRKKKKKQKKKKKKKNKKKKKKN